MSTNARVPPVAHALAGAWLVGIGLYGVLSPDRYEVLLQEDRVVEWATVWLFLMAGAIGLLRSILQHRFFDGLVALFCLFVAGEEFSWGQRLFGYYPAEFFLENNFQQEANLHNLPQSFLQPKWVLMIALGCYGVLLPVMARRPGIPPWLARIGATAPAVGLLPWFTAAIVLLLWYPLSFTGEWVEAFAGGLFLMSSGASVTGSGLMLALAVGLAAAMTSASGRIERGRDVVRIACAEQEIRGLVKDIAAGSAGTGNLWRMRRIHKRLWSSIGEAYLQADELRTFNDVACDESASTGVRRKYGIDPWGSPYWLEVERMNDDQRQVLVYSFGPNRRRDRLDADTPHADGGDDIRAVAMKRVKPD